MTLRASFRKIFWELAIKVPLIISNGLERINFWFAVFWCHQSGCRLLPSFCQGYCFCVYIFYYVPMVFLSLQRLKLLLSQQVFATSIGQCIACTEGKKSVERYWSNNVLGETHKTLRASFRKIFLADIYWDFLLTVTGLDR